jgi:hypothetical protein
MMASLTQARLNRYIAKLKISQIQTNKTKKSGGALNFGCFCSVYALTRDVKITRECFRDRQTTKVRPGHG